MDCKKTLFFLCIIFSSSIGWAVENDQELNLSLGELLNLDVNAVSFFVMETDKAPGSVQTFLMDDIEASSIRTIGDLVDMQVIGMAYGMNEAMGALIGSRGVMTANNAKTLIMLDGQQLQLRSHGYGEWLMNPLLGDIQSIEVVNGPGAIVHGSGAINGFYNLMPKNGKDNKGFHGSLEYGEFESLAKAEIGYGLAYGDKKDVYFYAGALEADGTDDYIDLWEQEEKDNEVKTFGYERSNFRLSTFWRHNDFSLNAFYSSINPSTNSGWADRLYLHRSQLGIRPKYVWNINDKNSIHFIFSGEASDVGLEQAGSNESHIETKIIFKTLSFEKQRIALGGLYGQREFTGKSQYFSSDYDEAYPINESEWKELGIFAEDIISMNNLTFSLGLRWDMQMDSRHVLDPEKNEVNEVDDKGHVSPRAALSYEFPNDSILKASYQQGFRYPDANYYNSTELMNKMIKELGIDEQLETLEPETMDSYELGYSQDMPGQDMTMSVNLFYNIYKDQLTWHNLSGYMSGETHKAMPWTGAVVNLKEEFKSYGTEFLVHWKPSDNFSLRGGYAFVETKDLDIERYQQHQVKVNMKANFYNGKLKFDLNSAWYSELPESEYRHEAYGDERLMIDLAAQYALSQNISIKTVAKNLLEEETPTTGYSINDPIHGHLGENERRFYFTIIMNI